MHFQNRILENLRTFVGNQVLGRQQVGAPQEFQAMGSFEPSRLLMRTAGYLREIPEGDQEDFVDISTMVSLPREYFDALEDPASPLDQKSREYVGTLQEHLYDPSGWIAEILQFSQLGRILNFQKKKLMELRAKFRQYFENFIVLVVVLFFVAIATHFLPWNITEFPTLKDIFLSIPNWISAFCLWQLVENVIQMKADGQFAAADLARIRLSLTTGNVINLLMRMVEKVTYIERRSDMHFPSISKFWMMLDEQVVHVQWHSHGAGFQRLEHLIKEFIFLKYTKAHLQGSAAVLAVIVRNFENAILTHFQAALTPDLSVHQRVFITTCISTVIPGIFQDNHYFAFDDNTQEFEMMEFLFNF